MLPLLASLCMSQSGQSFDTSQLWWIANDGRFAASGRNELKLFGSFKSNHSTKERIFQVMDKQGNLLAVGTGRQFEQLPQGARWQEESLELLAMSDANRWAALLPPSKYARDNRRILAFIDRSGKDWTRNRFQKVDLPKDVVAFPLRLEAIGNDAYLTLSLRRMTTDPKLIHVTDRVVCYRASSGTNLRQTWSHRLPSTAARYERDNGDLAVVGASRTGVVYRIPRDSRKVSLWTKRDGKTRQLELPVAARDIFAVWLTDSRAFLVDRSEAVYVCNLPKVKWSRWAGKFASISPDGKWVLLLADTQRLIRRI